VTTTVATGSHTNTSSGTQTVQCEASVRDAGGHLGSPVSTLPGDPYLLACTGAVILAYSTISDGAVARKFLQTDYTDSRKISLNGSDVMQVSLPAGESVTFTLSISTTADAYVISNYGSSSFAIGSHTLRITVIKK
jgi:hypothetical protein